ncbi:Gp53 protein [Paenibacillus mucilaginosus 3016]|uniref:Gp53 protein n=1 Tax=Paenibacillus mucilaginosus 3016 TaxID=1116391 RepID=H6NDV6_9BACL|nr:hypothetical protein [Paenibacillus mucilaginosus]AFC32155.1 Gp53 protein [Paenibacillus mucilaginosus 3016]WFA20656.1 transcriptional regulator [Paenibacillus mucilaginosus]
MSQIKIKRGTYQHVEDELREYHETRKEIIRIKNELLQDQTGCPGTLIMQYRKHDEMQRIIDAIDGVVLRLPADKQELIKLRYWTRPQLLTWEGIAQKLYCTKRTAYRWRDEIVEDIANRLGWW